MTKKIARRTFRKRVVINIKLKETFKIHPTDEKFYQVLGIELSRNAKKVIVKCSVFNNEFDQIKEDNLVSLILDIDSKVYI